MIMIDPPRITHPDWQAITSPQATTLRPCNQQAEIDCLAIFLDGEHDHASGTYTVAHDVAPAIIAQIVDSRGLTLTLDGREVLAAGGRVGL